MQTNTASTTRDLLAKRVLNMDMEDFDELSLDIFRYQFTHNNVYREYCSLFGKNDRNVQAVAEIPFLPISFFKSHDIHTNAWKAEVVFESSATTGQIPSRHAIRDMPFYNQITVNGFKSVFGHEVSNYCWMALLPSYVERPTSSLVHMISYFIEHGKPGSRFIHLREARQLLEEAGKGEYPVALIGVSFALLDLIEDAPLPLKNTLIIETGGMKGRRQEITRTELHESIKRNYQVPTVCSEYGMTELLSQAWSTGVGIFQTSPSLHILIRDIEDPLSLIGTEKRGGINCIDLANVDTCAFIATDDLGIVHEDGSFEVLGRFDASELRGCNLMSYEV